MPLALVTSLPQARQLSPGLPIKCGVQDMRAGLANNALSTGCSGGDRGTMSAGPLMAFYSLHSGPSRNIHTVTSPGSMGNRSGTGGEFRSCLESPEGFRLACTV